MKWGRAVGRMLVFGAALAVAGAAQADLSYDEVVRGAGRDVRRETTLRQDRRRIATTSAPAGQKGARREEVVEITRLDRDTVWLLEPGTKTYRESSLERVRDLVKVGSGQAAATTAQPLRSLYQTGQPQIEIGSPQPGPKIAGFPTEKVKATMVVPLKNRKTGSQARGRFEEEIWLARDPRLVDEVRRFEEACARKVGTAESLARIQTGAGPWMDALVPEMRSLEGRIRALGGFVMKSSLTVVWEALPSSARERPTLTNAGTITSEVTAVRLDATPDTAFEVPAGYQPPGQPLAAGLADPAAGAEASDPGPPTAAAQSPPSAALRDTVRTKRRRKADNGRERLGSKFHGTLPDGAAVTRPKQRR